MRFPQTQTVEWCWFLRQERSSQPVGFTRSSSMAAGAVFSLLCFYRLCCVAGIDLMDLSGEILQPKGDDVARISWNLRQMIVKFQETFSVIEKVRRCELFFPLN